jgi:acyl carrier protein
LPYTPDSFLETSVKIYRQKSTFFDFFKKTIDKKTKCIYNIGRCVNNVLNFGGIEMFEKVKALLMEELQIDGALITPDAELSADLGINSIELADLVMICEEQYDLVIEDESLSSFITVGDVVNYLEENC